MRPAPKRELRDDLDPVLVADTLIGPLFYRRLMTPEPLPPERADEIVSLVDERLEKNRTATA